MARKPKPPCEWCESEQFIHTEEDARNVHGQVEIYPENGFISVWFSGYDDDGGMTSEESIDLPMNFCPNCGRRLGY